MKYAYFPGCSLNSTGIEYNLSAKYVAKKLDVEFWEIPDWNCCGASAAHYTDHMLALALPARNLAIAEKEGLDVAIPCAACFARSKYTAEHVKSCKKTQQAVSEVIETDYHARTEVLSLLDVLGNKVAADKIKAQVVKPLSGLKVACYYGCLLVRPPQIAQFDDTEDPQTMDNIMKLIGAEPIDWAFKVECCGAGHPVVKPAVGQEMLNNIYKNAMINGAEAIATACPLCMLNLDMRQKQVNAKFGTNYQIPVYYFTELMGASFGATLKDLGIDKHFVPAEKQLENALNSDTRRNGA